MRPVLRARLLGVPTNRALAVAFALGAVTSCGGDQPAPSPTAGSTSAGTAGAAASGGASAGAAGSAGANGGTAGGSGAAGGGPGGLGGIGGNAGSSGHAAAAGSGADAGASSGGGPGGQAGAAGLAGSAGIGGAAGAGGSGGDAAGSSGAGGERPTVTPDPGTTLVKVDVTTRHQTFEGWGTSLCWWANHVGGWSAAARNAVVEAVVNPVSGLGYNLFRYNIGGGENPSHEHMGEHREMPGFAPSAGTWDWNADERQRAILQRIVETGSDVILEAFSNSPPHWMTKSGCASGSSDGSNNLKDDSYDAFADYLTEVVQHYRDELGITFRTLEPLNEPNANWWKSNGSQEGCHFSPSNQETIIKAVAQSLAEKGLTDTVVSASDENSMDDAYNNLRSFDDSTLAVIGQLNVHSYAGSMRRELRDFATGAGKRLWQSESGPLGQSISDDTDAALFMAGRIISDLRELGAEAWVDWQVGDPSRSWASIALNDAQQSFSPIKRFYMHAGFSRYIRPGAVFVDVNHPDMVAALSPDGASVAVVVRNGDRSAEKRFTFDLTTLPSVGDSAEALRTSRSEDLVSLPSVAIEGYRFVVTVPAFSVTTFVVPIPS